MGSGSGTTSLNYVPRNNTSGSATAQRTNLFRVDGIDYAVRGDGSGVKGGSTAVTNAIAVGDPVVFPIPEPAGVGLMGIGALALIRRVRATKTATRVAD